MADIDAGKVDVIVVYKVDRLSRSLLDFVKVMERLGTAGASFVSVTQNFSATGVRLSGHPSVYATRRPSDCVTTLTSRASPSSSGP